MKKKNKGNKKRKETLGDEIGIGQVSTSRKKSTLKSSNPASLVRG